MKTLPSPSEAIRGFSWVFPEGMETQALCWRRNGLNWEVASLRLRNIVVFQGFYGELSGTLLNIYGSWNLSHGFLREAKRTLQLSLGSVQRKRMGTPSEHIWRTSDSQQHGTATIGVTLVGTCALIRTQPSLLSSPFKLLRVVHHLKEGNPSSMTNFIYYQPSCLGTETFITAKSWSKLRPGQLHTHISVCAQNISGKCARHCWQQLPQSSETADLGRGQLTSFTGNVFVLPKYYIMCMYHLYNNINK